MSQYPIAHSLQINMRHIKRMAKLINYKQYEDLGLVCTGSSGAILAAIIASKIKPIPNVYYIKKKYEHNHGHGSYSLRKRKNLIFVDDFIATGSTVKHVIKQLKKYGINQIQGICMMYSQELKSKYIKKFFSEQFYAILSPSDKLKS